MAHPTVLMNNNNKNTDNNGGGAGASTYLPAKHYISPEQDRMLRCFHDSISVDYVELANVIHSIESTKAPDSGKSSRLLMRHNSEDDTMMMLAHRHKMELRCILDNTLPQALRGPLRGEMIEPLLTNGHDGYEPVIYSNYIVEKNGKGLTLDEFSKLLDVIEVVVSESLEDDEGSIQDSEDGDEEDENELDTAPDSQTDATPQVKAPDPRIGILRRFNAIFQNRTKGGLKKFWDTVEPELRGMWEHRGKDFVHHYRNQVIPEAKRQGATHIMVPPEVGLSAKGYRRVIAHLDVGGPSPLLFRLIQVAIFSLFPGRFSLMSVYIFELSRFSQAEVGESIVSVMCGSYGSCGGLNFHQPDISETKIVTMNMNDWNQVSVRHETYHRHRYVEGNIHAYTEELDAVQKKVEEETAGILRNVEWKSLQDKIREETATVAAMNAENELLLAEYEREHEKLKTAIRAREKSNAEEPAIHGHINKLFDGLLRDRGS